MAADPIQPDQGESKLNSTRSGTQLPTKTARRFVFYVVGFGVAVGVGLAPYLGKLDIPLFSPLLDLIPANLQDTLIPLSTALMGVVAVAIQWYGSEHLSKRWLRRNFGLALIGAVALFLTLVAVHSLVVIRVPVDGATHTVAVLIGWDERPTAEPCGKRISDAECVQKVTLDPAQIESFWGSRSMRRAQLALTFLYLGFTGAFAWLVGLLVLLPQSSKDEVSGGYG